MRYDLINNNGSVYYDGSKWMSNNCGEFTVVGKINRYCLDNGRKKYPYYLCQFDDGTMVEVHSIAIHNGNVKNPNFPSVFGVGYIGDGEWKSCLTIDGKSKLTREYITWSGMIERCYDKSGYQQKFPTYKECVVDERWHSFQNFCNDICLLENYHQWKNNDGWELDKDIKVKGNKLYSKDTCIFVLRRDNTIEMIQRTIKDKLTGLTYIGISPSGEVYEFENQIGFAREFELSQNGVNNCINNKQKIHKGWTFKVKE